MEDDREGFVITQQYEIELPVIVRGHMDAACKINTWGRKMAHEQILQEIINSLQTMKAGKAAHPDKMKPYLLRRFKGIIKVLGGLALKV